MSDNLGMKLIIIGHTNESNEIKKEDILLFSGRNAGICYMKDNWDMLSGESQEKTLKRAKNNLINQHHSVYDHYVINMVFEGIPKFLAMILNNQGLYATSEKSARYTKMELQGREKEIYDKWLKIFLDLINKKYPKNEYNNCAYWGKTDEANDNKRVKLAQENARYLTSVFTPTTMSHTINIRQLNYVYNELKNLLDSDSSSRLIEKSRPYVEKLIHLIEENNLVINGLDASAKSETIKFFDARNYQPTKIYDDIYQTYYNGSLAQLAQAQRHRTINYRIKELDNDMYFVPPILRDNEKLVKEFLQDLYELENIIPQATMVEIRESGSLDNLLLKLKERKCSYAQLEINDQSQELIKEYHNALKKDNHPRANEIEKYTYGARCTFPDYTCPSPCGFKEGVQMTREI